MGRRGPVGRTLTYRLRIGNKKCKREYGFPNSTQLSTGALQRAELGPDGYAGVSDFRSSWQCERLCSADLACEC